MGLVVVTPYTLDELIDDIRTEGWRINNLFELPGGKWRASLCFAEISYQFGEGVTPREALANARKMPKWARKQVTVPERATLTELFSRK